MRLLLLVLLLLALPDSGRAQNLTFQYNVVDTEIAEILAEQQVTLPIPIRGRVTVTAELSVPRFSVFNRSAYRMTGTAASPEMEMAGVKLKQVEAALFYERGILVVDFTADTIEFDNQDAVRIYGRLIYAPAGLTYSFNADWLGGHIHLDGFFPLRPVPNYPAQATLGILMTAMIPETLPGFHLGSFELEEIQLGRLWSVLGGSESYRYLDGLITYRGRYRHRADGMPDGSGKVTVDTLRWRNRKIWNDLRGVVVLNGNQVSSRYLDANFGDGSLTAEMVLRLADLDASTLRADLRSVPLERLLLPILEFPEGLHVPVSGRIASTFGNNWRGGGILTILRGEVFGVPVTEVRMPVDWEFRLSPSRGHVTIRELHGEVAQGRFNAQTEVMFSRGGPTRLAGDIRFNNVNANAVIRAISGSGQGNGGYATGRIDFSADDYRDSSDLKASLRADLKKVQIYQLSLFEQVARLLAPIRNLSQPASAGKVYLTLSRGVIRVREFALVGSGISMWIDGTATLDGRLRLTILANTGRLLVDPTFLRLAGITLTLSVGGIPLAVLLEARRYIFDRTLQFNVTGTFRRPVVRIDALATLSEEALRFFLDRANLPLR